MSGRLPRMQQAIVIGGVTITLTSETDLQFGELRRCASLSELRLAAARWAQLLPEVIPALPSTDEEFEEFQRFVAMSEGRLNAPSDDALRELDRRYGDLVLPRLIFEVAGLAETFTTPWGAMFLRLKQIGMLKSLEGGGYALSGKVKARRGDR